MNVLERIPFQLLILIVGAYVGLNVYDFQLSETGEVAQHQAKLAQLKEEREQTQKKLKEGQKFVQSLEAKKEEMRALFRKLSEYQGALGERVDVAAVMKTLLTEAKKLDLKVEKLEPGKQESKEYFFEQEVKLDVRGSYSQIALFLKRIAQLQRILRTESFALRTPSQGTPGSKVNTLQASLSIRTYQYMVSREDQIAKDTKL